MESQWEGIMKVCINCPERMAKMAVMPIYGKNSPEPYYISYLFSSPEPLGSQGELIGWP